MKRKLLTFVLSLIFLGAYATPRVTDFRIDAGYLLPGSLTLNVANDPTAFHGTFTVLRGTASGTSQPENIFCAIDVVLVNKAGAYKKSLSTSTTFVTDDNTSNYTNRSINATISKGDIAAGDMVELRITYQDSFGNQVTTLGGGFTYTINSGSTPTQPTDPGDGSPTDPGDPSTWPIGYAGPISNIAAVDIDTYDRVFFWSLNGKVTIGNSTSATGPTTPYYLPQGKKVSDILGVGIASSNGEYTWYKDGTMTIGSSAFLGRYSSNIDYKLPAGKTPADIVGIAIAKNTDYCYAWYKDGTVSVGKSDDLGYVRAPYQYYLPPGKKYTDIVEIGIAGSSSWVYTWYSDNTMSVGTSDFLDYYIPLKPMN